MNITLRNLTKRDEEKFFKALNAPWEKDFSFAHYWESIAQENYGKYIKCVPGFSKGEYIPREHVPCTLLFAFNEKDELIGRVSIRHELNNFLIQEGGHIGYGVVPEFRKKGYATAILRESLIWTKNNLPEINQVLVTCDEGNIGSQKTIERNGGKLENIIDLGKEKRKMRFWIEVT